MSNFAFLRDEWPELCEEAQRAERNVLADPRAACFYARRTLELSLNWVYDADRSLDRPHRNDLSAKIHEPTLRALIGQPLFTKMQVIRKRGNAAVHDRRAVSQGQARTVTRELFHVLYWLARTYTRQPAAAPERGATFDDALLPQPVSHEDHQQTRAQLQQLADRLAARDAALAAKREQNAALQAELAELQAEVAAAKAANVARPDPHDYDEQTTRDEFIDVLLQEAGWPLDQPADREFRVTGMPNSSGIGLVDYVLWGDDGKPLALVEAKRTRRDALDGQHQAKLYADCLEATYGQRPLIYYTNGYDIWCWDDLSYPPRPVQGYLTKEDLQLLMRRRTSRRPLTELEVAPTIVDRYYQRRAITRITESFDRDRQRKALLVMATGAGKTRTVVALADVLMRANWVKRVLFLADRVALVKQATHAFRTHLPEVPVANLLDDSAADARVSVSTYPTIMGLLDQTDRGVRRFSPGHFDLVVVDEAHRSVYQKYRTIFSYFDALLVGLTATPKDEVDRNTYELFDLEEGVPTDAYELEDAVADGYLVPPRAVSVPLKFPREGIRYDDLSETDRDQWERLEWSDDGTVPDRVEAEALNSWLFNADTVDKVLETLMTRGHRVAGGDRIGKTIIFARNTAHAAFIAQRFDVNYPQYRGEVARVVTHQTAYAQSLIDDFSLRDKAPHIAISVDMLDTGVDIPEVVNLVFFKPVYSKTKFWQMLGRGTRPCPDLFGPGAHKRDFYVFDCCENFEYFSQDPPEVEGTLAASLTERLFRAKLELVCALDQQFGTAGAVDPPAEHDGTRSETGLRWDVVHELHSQIRGLTVENVMVRPHRRTVETYSDLRRWRAVTPQAVDELATLAGLPLPGRDDDEAAKRFDLMIRRLQLGRLTGDASYRRLRGRVQEIASALLEQTTIPAVQRQQALLTAVAGDAWWREVSLPMLEQLRRQVRDLVRLVEKSQRTLVYTNFADELGEIAEIPLRDFAGSSDLERLRQKVQTYLRAHEDHLALQKVRRNRQLSPTDLAELERMLADCGDAQQIEQASQAAHGLGRFIRSLVGLDREAAKEAFGEFLAGRRLSANQIHFIDLIVNYLTDNGVLEPGRLYESPFTDLAPHGPESLFADTEVATLLTILRGIDETADPTTAAA